MHLKLTLQILPLYILIFPFKKKIMVYLFCTIINIIKQDYLKILLNIDKYLNLCLII